MPESKIVMKTYMNISSRRQVVLGTVLAMSFIFAGVTTAQTTAPGAPQTAATVRQLSEDEKINGLIAYIARLEGATFERNGTTHSAGEAAEHLKAKYNKHKAKIPTAENFIQNLASKSSMSGKEYMIRFQDGQTVAVGKLLNEELQRLTAQTPR